MKRYPNGQAIGSPPGAIPERALFAPSTKCSAMRGLAVFAFRFRCSGAPMHSWILEHNTTQGPRVLKTQSRLFRCKRLRLGTSGFDPAKLLLKSQRYFNSYEVCHDYWISNESELICCPLEPPDGGITRTLAKRLTMLTVEG
jgi:hypothetical protein